MSDVGGAEMIKIAFIGDPHVSDKAPSTRTDDYCNTVLNKLKFIVTTCIEEKVQAIVILGDIFHKKIPSHTSHETIRRLIDIFKCDIPIFSVAGNHDINGTYNEIHRQPFSVLRESGVLNELVPTKATTFTDGKMVVALSGSFFRETLDSKEHINEYNLSFPEDSDYNIGVFHQMILPDGQTFFSSYVNFSDLMEVNSDLIAVGHYHVGFKGSIIRQEYKHFLNPGSMSRGSTELFNLEKEPKFSIVTLEKLEDFVSVQHKDVIIPHKDSKEIFDLEAVTRKKENIKLKDFFNNLNEVEIESLAAETPEGVLETLKRMGMNEDLSDLCMKYLIQTEGRIDS